MASEDSTFQLIKETETTKNLILAEEDLEKILMAPEVKDRYISIICITGTFRQGKSFLLNFFVRYLKSEYVKCRNVEDWLHPKDGPLLQEFQYKYGTKGHTMGMTMYSSAFLIDIPRGDQIEKVAVLLMDTQGAFDHQSTINDCAKFFVLSTLLSSVQIYNVLPQLNQADLQHLQNFGTYGINLANKLHNHIFQNLLFLIRDWPCEHEKPYGLKGGEQYLKEIKELSNRNEEGKSLWEHVDKLFSNKLECFLMPEPGDKVKKSVQFSNDLNDISPDFITHVQSLVIKLCAPENLILKTINGKKVTAEEYLIHAKGYYEAFKYGKDLPKMMSVAECMINSNHKANFPKSVNYYEERMIQACIRSMQAHEFYKISQKLKRQAAKRFKDDVKITNTDITKNYMNKLKEAFEKTYIKMKRKNDIKFLQSIDD